ncbi:TPA: VirB4-like conjugal transfer ATPase, CD1110 family [Streptococcus pyogenes]
MRSRENIFRVMKKVVERKKEKSDSKDILNYDEIYANGVCRTGKTYSKMIEFSDISYQLSQDDMKVKLFTQYSTLVNSFDSKVQLQLFFVNYKIEEEATSKLENTEHISEEEFDFLKEEYFNFLDQQRSKGTNGIIRNKHFVFSIQDDNSASAFRRLQTIQNTIKDQLKIMGSGIKEIDGIERLMIVNYLLNGKDKSYVDLSELNRDFVLKNSKEYIAPRTIDFGLKKDIFKLPQKYGSTLLFSVQATELSDRVLADFLDLEIEQICSLHIRTIDKQKAVKMVKGKTSDLNSIKIDEQKKAVKAGYDFDILPMDLNTHVEESKKILTDLQRENEKYFYLTFTITIFEDSLEELENAIYKAKIIAEKQDSKLVSLSMQQEQAIMSALPFGYNINEIDHERGLTTSAVAIFVPFTTQELYQEDNTPVYYGLNALSNNMIQVSRKSLKNPNGLFLGTPGSGKSFSAKREIIDTFLRTQDDILICDPEGEYYPFIKRLKGEEIRLALNSKDFINPLDISLEYGEGENPISFKSDFIINLMQMIAGGKSGLTAKQKTITDKCTRIIYRDYIENPTEENIPILEDLYNELLNQNSVEAQDMADALELYVHGSLNVFNHRTTIDTNNRLICFNIQELGSNLKDLGMLILQDHVWNRVTVNRNKSKKTWYYMDEFHKLLADEQTSNYSVEFWKRFRKWGGIPTGITQNVQDLLASPKIETIIENSDFIYLLNQATRDRKILQEKLEISDYQAGYITNSEEGEGLIVYSGVILPFRDKFPHNNSLYPVMTTKPEEIKKLRK